MLRPFLKLVLAQIYRYIRFFFFSFDSIIDKYFLSFSIFQGWKEQVGKVYRRCLQVHPDKADLRVSSGRYELEQALADISSEQAGKATADSGLRVENARTVFMEAIRFHPKVLARQITTLLC